MSDVDAAVSALNRMTVTQLRERYSEVFGEAARSFNKQHLVKRIAWRLRANEEGDLSERSKAWAKQLAADSDVRLTAPKKAPLARPIPLIGHCCRI